ncbi:unnamed protein product [Schistosoma curassoni]|uniref:Uncharacterized protein n=1 Tax=Schistosoma curassoni TaxID=6186 RepID=A0A183JDQ2_9TREM|nr:unnamed protein product [Schistosoma curassoni]
MNQSSYTGWNNCSSRSYHVRQVLNRCDGSEVFPSDNQRNSDAAFPQRRVGLEKIYPKNAHLALSHRYPSSEIRSQQVLS